MITRIQIDNFKSLEKIDLRLGSLNLFVGANSSGKSNFLDALRVLQGAGNGFTVSEIFNGKPRTATTDVWDGIRGGSEFATFRKQGETSDPSRVISFEVEGSARPSDSSKFVYHLAVSAKTGRVMSEWLLGTSGPIFDSRTYENSPDSPTINIAYSTGRQGPLPKKPFERSRPSLHQFVDRQDARPADRRIAEACIVALADLQRLDPSPEILRMYSSAQTVARMGEHGENFAALVNAIAGAPQNKQAYMEWLKELSPADVDDVAVLRGALGEPLFAVTEGGKTFPAPTLSDGTLRFAAIAAAFFQESVPAVLLLEEIEKGVHPNRLRLLVELLRSQTKRLETQVIATTHSPDILAWLDEADLKFTFAATRQFGDGASTIRSIGEMDAVKAILASQGSLPELFSEGWLESVA